MVPHVGGAGSSLQYGEERREGEREGGREGGREGIQVGGWAGKYMYMRKGLGIFLENCKKPAATQD